MTGISPDDGAFDLRPLDSFPPGLAESASARSAGIQAPETPRRRGVSYVMRPAARAARTCLSVSGP